MAQTREQATDYCRTLIAQADRDRYLSSLLAPARLRESLWALYAFNTELATVRESVSEPNLGEIRLQWWRDTIDGLYAGKVADHPVAIALGPVIAQAGLAQSGFTNMIEARTFDLYDDPMPTMNDLEGYLGETSAMVMQMAARILVGEDADALADVSGMAGVAYGLTGLLRSLPIHCARGQCYVPVDMLARLGLTPAHLLSRKGGAEVDAMMQELAGFARMRLGEARALLDTVPEAALAAYWPASLVDVYLPKLLSGGHDPLRALPGVSQLRVQSRLWRMALTRRF